jgi:hypothetical protein
MNAIPDQANTEGDTVSLTVSASDSISGATLHYSATGLPAGLKINTATGAITGTVAAGAAAWGPYSVTVTAGDSSYSASQTFSWSIIDPINILDPGTENFSVGASVNVSIKASDTHTGTLSYFASGLPAGLTINCSTGVISGTISNSPQAAGSISSRVTVSDGTDGAHTNIYWDILTPNSGLVTVTAKRTTAVRPPKMLENPPEKDESGNGNLEGATFDLEKGIGGGQGTVKVLTGGTFDDGKNPPRLMKVSSPKNCIRLEFTSANKQAVKEAHWLQFFRVTLVNKKWLQIPGSNLFFRPGGPRVVDTDNRADPLYDLHGLHTIRTPQAISIVDSPFWLYYRGNKIIDKFDDYLIIKGKVCYHVAWQAVFTWNSRERRYLMKYRKIAGEPVSKEYLPKFASGSQVFLGWKKYSGNKFRDPVYVDNPIER